MSFYEYVQRETDKTAVHKVINLGILAVKAVKKITLSTSVGVSATNVEIDDSKGFLTEAFMTNDEGMNSILEADGYLINSISMNLKYNDPCYINIVYRRNHDKPGGAPHLKNMFDFLEITVADNDPAKKTVVVFAKIVAQSDKTFHHISSTSLNASIDSNTALLEQQRNEYMIRQEAAIDLLHKKAADITSEVAGKILILTTQLEEDHRKQSNKLQDERTVLLSSVEAEKLELSKQRHEVAEKAHRVLRLDTADSIEKKIDKSLGNTALSWPTKRRIIPAFLAYLLLPVALFVATIYLGYIDKDATINTGDLKWYIVLREILLASGFVATMSFFILWLRRIYEKTANREMNLQKLKVDMLRASWLYELVLEWKKAYPDEELPEQFIERFSRDLFVSSNEVVDDRASLDLLKATKLKFSEGEFEVAFNDKAAKKEKTKKKKGLVREGESL